MISRVSYYLSSSFELKVHFVIVHFRSLAFLHPYLVDFSALLWFLFFLAGQKPVLATLGVCFSFFSSLLLMYHKCSKISGDIGQCGT